MPFEEFKNDTTVASKPRSKAKMKPRGCEVCPLNNIPGVHKIMGHMHGRKILIVGQSPSPEDNDQRREFSGNTGEFLWTELNRVGITRADCDIQNVVRCMPAKLIEGSYNSFLKLRAPSTTEIHACSIHTENAMKDSKAEHILVLGQVAAKSFLNARSVPHQKIFWSEEYHARIYLTDHPGFFTSGYSDQDRLAAFRSMLDELSLAWRGADRAELSDPFSYIKKQNYHLVCNKRDADNAREEIHRYAKSRRISVDIEYDTFDGKEEIIAVGFCPRPSVSYVFVTRHADVVDGASVWRIASEMLVDPSIRKVFHFGCSDVSTLAAKNVDVASFEWDTLFAEYCYYPDAKAYGLAAIAERRFRKFSGYKNIIAHDLMLHASEDCPPAVRSGAPEAQLKWLSKHGQYHLSNLSLETLRLYNGADCDLTKRIEVDTKKKVSRALVRMYIDLSFVLREMEPNGPLFDFTHHAKMNALYPALIAKARQKLCDMTGNPDFNPASPQQVYKAVYEQFGLVYPLSKGKPNTQKKTMMMLSRNHEFPGAVVEWRRLDKAKSTYIDGQLACALSNGGRLRTVWHSTGTRTGRLSSSGGDLENGVNLQNLHGNPFLKNMLCADLRWRIVFNAIARICRNYHVASKQSRRFIDAARAITKWLEMFMPDLMTFLALDYGQVEVRVMAQMSRDVCLLLDCMSSDIHSKVGVTMTGWDIEKIRHDKKTRTLTKNIHFGIMFGIDKNNLYEFICAMDPTFDGTREMVFEAYDRYFARYTGVRKFMDSQRVFALEHGYVETLFGLRQPLTIDDRSHDLEIEFISEDSARHASWRNQAINGPVQGTAHQLMECALVNLKRQPEKYNLLRWPSLEVHDALYNMVRVVDLPAAAAQARYLLEKESLETVKRDFPQIEWKVPIVTEVEAGLRLGCMIEIDSESVTPGEFLLNWFFKARAQALELEEEMSSTGVHI